jgi:hypothetical protein
VAGGHAGQEDLDGAARLLLDHPGEHHGAVGADGAEQHHGHDEGGGLVVRAAAGPATQLDVGHRRRLDDAGQLVGIDPGHAGALLHGHQVDGAGDHGLELLVGAGAPLQPPGVHHQDVDVAVPHRRLARGRGVVAVEHDRGLDRLALGFQRRAQGRGRGAGQPDVLGPGAVVEQRRQDDGRGHRHQHQHQRHQEGPGAPALAQLAGGDQPGLRRAVHAATASRNSSDRVGGS